MKKTGVLLMGLICLVLIFPSCSYTLKLNGSLVPANLKTVRVDLFENNAALVVGTLSQTFTEALKDRIRTTTKLSIVRGDAADATFTGSITDYRIAPVSIQATNPNVPPIAGASSLTITVHVKYVSDIDKKDAFDQSFSKSENYTGDIAAHEQQLIADLTKQLIEDIFNKAFANW